MTNPEIAIVGAGMAGFGATYQLSQQKLRPVIYDELTSAFSRPPSQDSSNAARYREPFCFGCYPRSFCSGCVVCGLWRGPRRDAGIRALHDGAVAAVEKMRWKC
jgi:hypothetical protein